MKIEKPNQPIILFRSLITTISRINDENDFLNYQRI